MNNYYRSAVILAEMLDNQFKIGPVRFGVDPLIGLIPGIGDFLSLGLSLYIVWVGIKMKIPQKDLVLMMRNVAIDLILGFIPVLGDSIDFFFKANLKNLAILRKYSAVSIVDGEIVG